MEVVELPPRSIDAYAEYVGKEAIAELRRSAAPLQGLRVLHVNATPRGGGVAELLRSLIPLLRDLGLAISWQTIVAEPVFFAISKEIHNALQGAQTTLTPEERAVYLEWQQRNAARLGDYDIIVVHDPQPFGLRQAAGSHGARWVWRLHLDSSQPDPAAWAFLRPLLAGYQAAVFTMPQFVPPDVEPALARIIAPAIDPLSAKNSPIPAAEALALLKTLELDPGRPLVSQVARLDRWKDPIGVIDAYRLLREAVPGVQLALLGVIVAQDDPEAVEIAKSVREHAAGDPDIHLYVDPQQVGAREVAAVQQSAQVVFQKSLREGFSLSVAEALWKATPVVGGRVGGIPLQLQDGKGGFLVESVAEAAERARWLLERPPEARSIAARGRDHIRASFLIVRLLADELRLYSDVLAQQIPAEEAAA